MALRLFSAAACNIKDVLLSFCPIRFTKQDYRIFVTGFFIRAQMCRVQPSSQPVTTLLGRAGQAAYLQTHQLRTCSLLDDPDYDLQ